MRATQPASNSALPDFETRPPQELVRWILMLVLGFTVVSIVCFPILGPPVPLWLAALGFGPFLGMYCFALWLNRRGRSLAAANLYLWGTYLGQLAVLYGAEAFKPQALLSFVNLMLCAGFLKGRREALKMGGACLLAVIGNNSLNASGMLPPSIAMSAEWVFLSMLCTLATTSGLVYIGTRFTSEAIRAAVVSRARAEAAAAQLAAASDADAMRVARAERLASMARGIVALREVGEIAREVATTLAEVLDGVECIILDSRGVVLSVSGRASQTSEIRISWTVAKAGAVRRLSESECAEITRSLSLDSMACGYLQTSRNGSVSLVLLGPESGIVGLDKDLQFNAAWHVLSSAVHRLHVEQALIQSQRMDALGHLSAGITHDFNNLLTSIIGGAELAGHHVRGNQAAETQIQVLKEAAERAAGLTGKLLAFSASASEGPESLETVGMIQNLLPVLRGGESDAIEFDVVLPDESVWVLADPVDLERAILNLVVNARNALEGEGRIEIGIERRSKRVGANDSEYVAIWVEDTGPGIPPELQGKVFEPFFSTRKERGASGLGLSIVYGVVQAMGGEVILASELGAGTRVEILLKEQPPGDRAPEVVPVDESVQSGRRILVVEDDPDVRDTVCEMLQVGGYAVCTAENGQVALDVLAAGESFALVLSDVVMPKLGGFELVRRLRERSDHPPIALVSGYAPTDQPQDWDSTIPMISKPFTLKRLLSFVEELT